MSYPKHMADLYRRLKAVGLERKYVQKVLLPDWWDDALADKPSNRRIAEMHIARILGIPPSSLADPEGQISLMDHQPRFKKWRGVDDEKLVPSVAMAARAAELTVLATAGRHRDLASSIDPLDLRRDLLTKDSLITLKSLLDWCWSAGLPVIHIPNLPSKARRVDGMALAVSGQPVVVLASNRKAPAWLTWYLAHEIGHIAKGHLVDGNVIDEHINQSSGPQEVEANHFAERLIYGRTGSSFSSKRRIKASSVAAKARRIGREHRISPGSIVVAYANTMAGIGTSCWQVASSALRELDQDSGGPETVRDALGAQLDLDRLTEGDRTFLTGLCSLED